MDLSADDRETYAWQLDVPGFGDAGQAKLRGATALVSRVGGLGGPLAQSLASAGFGKIILAHGGSLREDDLNRQILMSRDWLGRSRVHCAQETLQRFNPRIEVEAVEENVNESNARELVAKADIVFGCAPLFEERLLMNRECVRQGIPLIDAAMFSMEGQVTTVVPGETACMACLYPSNPPHWKRRFPVIGAVSALVANMAALEGIKLLVGMPGVHSGQLVHVNASNLQTRLIRIKRLPECTVCGSL